MGLTWESVTVSEKITTQTIDEEDDIDYDLDASGSLQLTSKAIASPQNKQQQNPSPSLARKATVENRFLQDPPLNN
ncbi:unnamed protein product [Didymodactylos carnosus]|uniref:Uncharacterized protein n=1 Tax=Didymodactylos carnosus TaxID=1234261 RepID=A0A8S2G7E9_9BILA|nr:unnamed protein product [Didymodactylos carnosus]CAF4491601.1 unnamed protein product [Didymodactylos carnosus]